MKVRFDNADALREAIPVGAKFKAACANLRVWSYDENKYVPEEDKHPRTAMLEDNDTIFIFNHRSRRYGYRTSVDWFIASYIVEYTPAVDPAVAWERRVKNVVKKLSASGLWPEIKKRFEELLEIGYERRKALKHVYWERDEDNLQDLMSGIINKRDGAVEQYNVAFERLYGKFMNEIPFAFSKSENGVWHVNTDYLYEMSDAKTKSMYFGKWSNARIKGEIQQAFAEKRRYSNRARTSYDVSFEYDPDRNKAWYSEEYKDCGNGHYYIAIDANTALFCEDD